MPKFAYYRFVFISKATGLAETSMGSHPGDLAHPNYPVFVTDDDGVDACLACLATWAPGQPFATEVDDSEYPSYAGPRDEDEPF
jgi:hypothetical protein